MRTLLLAIMLCVASLAQAQRPQPWVAGGAILNGSGQDNIGWVADGGVQWDTAHFLTIEQAQYSTGGKTNDNDNTSSAGHDRSLQGDTYVRVKSWGFGPGVSWSKLYTPAYTKSSVHPRFGVDKEFQIGRLTITYVHPGTDWINGVQGFEGGLWLGKGHFFYRTVLGAYWFHSTVTDRSNKQLTAAEKSVIGPTSQLTASMGFRF